MVGDTFKETATLRKGDGVFYDFGVTPNLRGIFGVKEEDPIYEVEFEVVEEKAAPPDEYTNDYIYYAYYDKGEYSLIQPNAEMFAMQFPWDIWKWQGEVKHDNEYFGIAVRIKPKKYTKLEE